MNIHSAMQVADFLSALHEFHPKLLTMHDKVDKIALSSVGYSDSTHEDVASQTSAVFCIWSKQHDDEWAIDAFFQRAQVAGVRLVVMSDNLSLHLSALLIAEHLNIAVVTVDDVIAAFLRSHEIFSVAETDDAVWALRAVDLTNLPMSDDVHIVLTRLRDIAGQDLLLVDESGWVLESTSTHRIQNFALDSWAASGRPNLYVVTSEVGSWGCIRVETGYGPRPWLCIELSANVDAELQKAQGILTVGQLMVAQQLALRRIQYERDLRRDTRTLEQLLDARGVVTPEIAHVALEAGWELGGYHLAAMMTTDVDPLRFTNLVSAVLERSAPLAHFVEWVHGWVFWFDFEAKPAPEVIRSLQKTIVDVKKQLPFTTAVGIGRSENGLVGLRSSLHQAHQAVLVAKSRPNTSFVAHIDTVSWASVVLAGLSSAEIRQLAESIFSPLLESNPKLVETLSVYLDAESSIVVTAEHLKVHRNTVAERIRKVEEQLDVDLKDPEARFALQMALRSMQSATEAH